MAQDAYWPRFHADASRRKSWVDVRGIDSHPFPRSRSSLAPPTGGPGQVAAAILVLPT